MNPFKDVFKKKSNKHFSLIVILTLALTITFSLITPILSQDCECPTSKVLDEEITTTSSTTIEEEIIDGKNYGKPIVISEMIILKSTIKVPQSITSIKNVCPSGYSLLTQSEIEKISTTASNYDLLIEVGVLPGQVVFSSTKTYPSKTNGGDSESWEFQALIVNKDSKSMKLSSSNTYFIEDAGVVICKSLTDVSIKVTPYDFNLNKSYELDIGQNNIIGAVWKIKDNSSSDGSFIQGKKISTAFKTSGCKVIQVWSKNVVNQIGYNCIIKYAMNYLGSDGTVSGITASDIDTKNFSSYVLSTQRSIFFNRVNSAIAAKDNGDFYVLFSNENKETKVLLISHEDRSVKAEIPIENNTFAMDIVATSFGFVVYLKSSEDNNYAFISGYEDNGKLKFKRVIMNNGDLPTKAKDDQVIFYNNKSEILTGINAMFAANNGKLAYGRGRIALIFAHYNHFGFKNDKRDDHTGDTFFTFNDDGENEDYAWSWKTSHSVIQSIMYDGRYFVTAALGDVYPENVNICFIEPYDYSDNIDKEREKKVNLNYDCFDDLIPGKIPGDGAGDSCGELGGITKIGDYYVLAYSRKACEIKAYTGGTTEDNTGEIGFIKFKFVNGKISEKKSYNIGDATSVIQVRAQKYGDKLIFVIATTQTPNPTGESNPNYYTGNEKTKIMVVDLNGNIVTEQFEQPQFITPVSEDLKYLKDGTVIWAVAEKDTKNLLLIRTPTPKFVSPYVDDEGSVVEDTSNTDITNTSTSTGTDIIITDGNNSNSSNVIIRLFSLFMLILLMF